MRAWGSVSLVEGRWSMGPRFTVTQGEHGLHGYTVTM